MKIEFITNLSTRASEASNRKAAHLKIAECSQKAAGQHIDLPPPPSDDGLTPALPEDVRRQNFVKAKAFAGIGTRAFRVLAEAMPQSPGAARTALRQGGRSENVPDLLHSHNSGGMIRAFR